MFESYASLAALRSALADAPEGVDFVAIHNPAGQTTAIEFFTSDEEARTTESVLLRTYDFEGNDISVPEGIAVEA